MINTDETKVYTSGVYSQNDSQVGWKDLNISFTETPLALDILPETTKDKLVTLRFNSALGAIIDESDILTTIPNVVNATTSKSGVSIRTYVTGTPFYTQANTGLPATGRISENGLSMIVADTESNVLLEFALLVPYDVVGISEIQKTITIPSGNNIELYYASPDGTNTYTYDSTVWRRFTSTAWAEDLTYDSQNTSLYEKDGNTYNMMEFNSTGTKLYMSNNVMQYNTVPILEYNVNTPWSITDITLVNTVSLEGPLRYISEDGTRCILKNTVFEMSTAFDLSTAVLISEYLGEGAGAGYHSILQVLESANMLFEIVIGLFINSTDGSSTASLIINSLSMDNPLIGETEYSVNLVPLSLTSPPSVVYNGFSSLEMSTESSKERVLLEDTSGVSLSSTNTTMTVDATNIPSGLITSGDQVNITLTDDSVISTVVTNIQDNSYIEQLGNEGKTYHVLIDDIPLPFSSTDPMLDMLFSSTGDNLLVMLEGKIYNMVLSVPYAVQTHTSYSVSVDLGVDFPSGAHSMVMASSGLTLYIFGSAGTCHKYALSVPWDVTTIGYTGVSFTVTGAEDAVRLLDNDTKLLVAGTLQNTRMYDVPNIEDLSNLTTWTAFSGTLFDYVAGEPYAYYADISKCVDVYSDGTIFCSIEDRTHRQFKLEVPYDLSVVTVTEYTTVPTYDGYSDYNWEVQVKGMCTTNDGMVRYVLTPAMIVEFRWAKTAGSIVISVPVGAVYSLIDGIIPSTVVTIPKRSEVINTISTMSGGVLTHTYNKDINMFGAINFKIHASNGSSISDFTMNMDYI